MRIIVKHRKGKYIFHVRPSDTVQELKEIISKKVGWPCKNFRLISGIESSSILLTDSFALSFFNLSENSIVEIEPIGIDSPSKIFKRQSSYLESIGMEENLPSRDSSPLILAIEACKSGSLKDLERVLWINEQTGQLDEDFLNTSPPNLWRPIHYACYYGHPEIVRFLVQKHVNVNQATVDEWTALQLACYQSNIESVQELLLNTNLQINKMTRFRGSGLHLACEVNDVDLVRLLLDNGAMVSLNDPQDISVFEKTQNDSILSMLAIAMGVEQLKKHSSEVPVSLLSELVLYTTFSIHGRPIVLHLDTQNRLLSRYSDMKTYSKGEPEFTTRLHDVQNVTFDEEKTTKEFFFTVESSASVNKYGSKDKKLINEWIHALTNAAKYFMVEVPVKEVINTKPETVKKNEEEVENHTVNNDTPVVEVINFESFELLEELGQGSFGVVYRVQKKNTKEIYAMKCLSKIQLKKQRQLKYAISECKIMKILKHPFVLNMFYAFQTSQSLYMILELCPNGDLFNLIEKYSKVSEEVAAFYVAETILALEYLHSLDIVYRDLKPANILIDAEGHAKLADFGLAKEDIKNTPAMTVAGTPAYLPPEIVEQKGASTASDIYSLGVMLYELLTGSLPYYNQDIQLLFDSIKKDKFSFPGFVSNDAKNLIQCLMHKKSEKRMKVPQIKKHAFFKKIDWEALSLRKVPVPKIN